MNRYICYSPLKDFLSSYRKLAWVGFEPTATEFRSDALSDYIYIYIYIYIPPDMLYFMLNYNYIHVLVKKIVFLTKFCVKN